MNEKIRPRLTSEESGPDSERDRNRGVSGGDTEKDRDCRLSKWI